MSAAGPEQPLVRKPSNDRFHPFRDIRAERGVMSTTRKMGVQTTFAAHPSKDRMPKGTGFCKAR